MTNFEFYKKELEEIKSKMTNVDNSEVLCDFVKTYAFIPPCRERKCGACGALLSLWLMEEHGEREPHRGKTEVNASFWAGDDGNGPDPGRYFANRAVVQ